MKRRRKHFTASSTRRWLSSADCRFVILVMLLCLAIAFYFAEKKVKAVKAKQKISILCEHIRIAEATGTSAKKALQNAAIINFEDGLEYYSALENKCRCIVTEDVGDFYFSEIEVLTGHDFFLKYMPPQRR